MIDLTRKATAEFVGTAFLVTAVIGSGIMATRLSPNDVGLQLLENSLITGAALVASRRRTGSRAPPASRTQPSLSLTSSHDHGKAESVV